MLVSIILLSITFQFIANKLNFSIIESIFHVGKIADGKDHA